MFKKWIAAILLVASLNAATPARAAVGLVTFSPTLIVVGACLTLAGSGAFVSFWHGHSHVRFVVGPVGLLGLILLDDQGGVPNAEFTSIDTQNAEKLTLNSAEQIAFNSELAEINAVKESLIAEGSQALEAGKVSAEQMDAFMNEGWANAARDGLISQDAFAALTKVRAQALN